MTPDTSTLPELLQELDAFVALDGGDLSVVDKAAAALRAQAEEVAALRARLPSVDEARVVLKGNIHWMTWEPECDDICLDGHWSFNELRAMFVLIEEDFLAHLAASKQEKPDA